MKNDQSFATWLKMRDGRPDDSEPPLKHFPDLELHFNFWYAYSSKRDREKAKPILDIGVLLGDFTHVESLNIYFPFEVTNEEISDLGKLLRSDVTLNAVFNDNHRIKSTSGGKSFLISCEKPGGNGNDSDSFHIYELDPHQDLKIEKKEYESGGGTVVSIPVAELGDLQAENEGCKRCYFRFRISSENLFVLVHRRNHRKAEQFFRDVLTHITVLEFRLNHSRSLPSSLREEIRKCGSFPLIKSLHFFLLTDETIDLLNDSRATIRKLEEDVWKGYLPETMDNGKGQEDLSNVIAYHWKEKEKDKDKNELFDWDLYAKMAVPFQSKATLLIYVLAIVAFGTIGSGVWTLIQQALAILSMLSGR